MIIQVRESEELSRLGIIEHRSMGWGIGHVLSKPSSLSEALAPVKMVSFEVIFAFAVRSPYTITRTFLSSGSSGSERM